MNGSVRVTDGHVFETDSNGAELYLDMGDYHGGPHCLVCDEYWCGHCSPKVYTEKCDARLETLDGLEYPQPPPPPLVVGRRIKL